MSHPTPTVDLADLTDDIDLFAGPGGWDQGIRPLGVRPLGIEWDEAACATARAAGHHRLQADIAHLDPAAIVDDYFDGRPLRGLIASPPCQGFSAAGKGRGRDDAALLLAAIPHMVERDVRGELHEHMTDDRSVLVLEPLRWALALTPQWLAWEQVPAVRPIWEACAEVLRSLGYSVAVGVLCAEQYGVPQTRKRAVLVARSPMMTAKLGPATLPSPTHSRYYPTNPTKLDPGVLPWVSMAEALSWASPEDEVAVQRGAGMLERHGDRPSRQAKFPAPTIRAGSKGSGPNLLVNGGTGWSMRSNYGTGGDPTKRGERTLQQPAPTVTSKIDRNQWRSGDPERGGVERVTLQDATLLQTFPADYPWQGRQGDQYRQVGDAVPPSLAAAVVAEVTGLAVGQNVEGAA